MPGGKIGGGGGGRIGGSGGGRIGGGGGGRIGGGSGGRIGGSRPSRPSGSRPSGGYSSSGGSDFWQGMLIGSMMNSQNRPPAYTPTGYNTQQGPFHQQPTFGQTQQQQQYQQATHTYHKRQTGSSGCVTVLIIMLVFMLLIFLLPQALSSGTRSTVERTKLDSKYVTETAYYQDNAGVVRSSATLEKGLRAFYDKTGIQPYVYFTPDINGDRYPSEAVADSYCRDLYSELFSDGGHLLVVSYGYDRTSYDYSDLGYTYCFGVDAKTVFDSEAQEIFENYVLHYADDLVNDEITLDELYSKAFSATGERIMQVTPNYSMIFIIAVVVLIILLLLYRWWQKVKEQKNKEAAHAEAVLNADINDLANDPTLSDLEHKYDDVPSPAAGTTTAAADRPRDDKPSYSPFGKVDTYESAREQELKDPTLQELEDKYQ